MTEHVTTLIVGSFEGAKGAENALKQIKDKATVKVHDAAWVEKDTDNRLHSKDTKDWGWGKGAVAGGIAGVVVGLLFPPAGIAIAAVTGAGAGALGAGLHDVGIKSDTLKALGATLAGGSSAAVLAVDPADAQAAEDELAAAGAKTVREGLSGEVVAALQKGLDPSADVKGSIARAAQDEARLQ